MSGQFIVPGWLVDRPDFGPDQRAFAEEIAKDFARGQRDAEGNYVPYEGHVEWIEHKPDPSWGSAAGSFWEVRAW